MSSRDWDIFGAAGPLRRELERFASALLSDREAAEQDDVWAPPVDIYERDDSLVLLVDLPGFTREEIDLQVDGQTLTLRGARVRTQPGRGLRLERPIGRFHRSFRIGVPIDPSRVEAAYRDGVLEISLPKISASGPARVPVDFE